jgi:hypothetical protein
VPNQESTKDREARAAADEQREEHEERDERTSDPGEDRSEAAGEGEEGAAARVAHALGVDDEEAPAAAEGGETTAIEAGPANRASRRREEALKRRRKKAGGAVAPAADGEEEDLPRDKNARAKELLLRRREQAAEREAAVTSGLLPGEMVDDALARATSGTMKWLRKNLAAIQWVAFAGIVVTAGALTWNWRVEKKAGSVSALLASAISAEHGRVMAEDKRSDDEKEFDSAKIYKTPEERADAALASYEKVVAEEPGSGPAILAALGEAGVLLEKRDWQKALDQYGVVLASKLAAADSDVRGRALEGSGFAKEGKGDLAGALASFKDMQAIEAKGFKELGQYHEARVLAAQGNKDKAKELLKSVREKLQVPAPDGSKPFKFLEAMVDRKLAELDPTAVPKTSAAPAPGPGGGAQLTPEQIEMLKKQFQKAAQDAAAKKQQGEKQGDK